MRRADMLLVNVLEKAPSKNAKATFTILLAKLLVHAAKGEDQKIDETLTTMVSHDDDAEKIRGYLAEEVRNLPQMIVASNCEEQGE